jgi:hypothetical protein
MEFGKREIFLFMISTFYGNFPSLSQCLLNGPEMTGHEIVRTWQDWIIRRAVLRWRLI